LRSIIIFAAHKTSSMETSNNSTLLDWIIFLVSLVAMIGLLMYASEWFWVALPFVLTYLVRALKMM
jgi:fatty acid desaturase